MDLNDFFKMLYPNEPKKQKIARELSKLGEQPPGDLLNLLNKEPELILILNGSPVPFNPFPAPDNVIGLTAKEITSKIREDASNKKVVDGVRRHLAEMRPYIGSFSHDNFQNDPESTEDVSRMQGRPPKRYYLNDSFWYKFKLRVPDAGILCGMKLVDPHAEQHRYDDERSYKAEKLAKEGDHRGIDQLIQLLSDDSERARLKAAYALGRQCATEALDPIVSMLSDESIPIRICAAKVLGDLGDERAVDALKMALNDSDYSVRNEAKDALEKLSRL